MKPKVHWIRYAVTMALCFGAYTEAGIWTALCLLLVFLSTEINARLNQRHALTTREVLLRALKEVANP